MVERTRTQDAAKDPSLKEVKKTLKNSTNPEEPDDNDDSYSAMMNGDEDDHGEDLEARGSRKVTISQND